MTITACRLFNRSRRLFVAGTGVLLATYGSLCAAQGTSGGIFGHGPAGAEVVATSSSGAQRHATINAKGRYTIAPVTMGTYAVTLQKDGSDVDTRRNVAITVGRGAEVDFACPEDNCAARE